MQCESDNDMGRARWARLTGDDPARLLLGGVMRDLGAVTAKNCYQLFDIGTKRVIMEQYRVDG